MVTWHKSFNPKQILGNLFPDKRLRKIEIYSSPLKSLFEPCLVCGQWASEGYLLNDKSVLCADCFSTIATIEYPEKYERVRREYFADQDEWERNKTRYLETCRESEAKRREASQERSTTIMGVGCVTFFLAAALPLLFFIPIICLVQLVRGDQQEQTKAPDYEDLRPKPAEPTLYPFHHPGAELTDFDRRVLYVFEHWPGYPPFWDYLRSCVRDRDRGRCQVTGCPSRTEIHVHHMKPTSQGGAHVPDNLVSLCAFHHALEPDHGHEMIWDDVKTRFFKLVKSHTRSNRVAPGTHVVKAHLRRDVLMSSGDFRAIQDYCGFACPQCQSSFLEFEVLPSAGKVQVTCNSCGSSIIGPHKLAEETGPQLAERLKVERNKGKWFARWDQLDAATQDVWSEWIPRRTQEPRHGEDRPAPRTTDTAVSETTSHDDDEAAPCCPKCGTRMVLKRPRPGDPWSPFWGCSRYGEGCRGARRIKPQIH